MSKPPAYDEPLFVLNAIKRETHSRTRITRHRTYAKINHAIRALWRIRNLLEGFVSIALPDTKKRNYQIISRVGKKRAIDSRHCADVLNGCPGMKDMTKPWVRLPNKHNNMFNLFEEKKEDDQEDKVKLAESEALGKELTTKQYKEAVAAARAAYDKPTKKQVEEAKNAAYADGELTKPNARRRRRTRLPKRGGPMRNIDNKYKYPRDLINDGRSIDIP